VSPFPPQPLIIWVRCAPLLQLQISPLKIARVFLKPLLLTETFLPSLAGGSPASLLPISGKWVRDKKLTAIFTPFGILMTTYAAFCGRFFPAARITELNPRRR
jgi:hypothetical protein